MLKIIICGINGRMGSLIYNVANQKNHHVVSGVDKKTVSQVDCPVYSSFSQIKEFCDVIIDFSSPSSLDDLLNYALINNIPLVIGTTGYNENQEKKILQTASKIPVFKSANTSLGITLLLKLCKLATSVLKGFDVEITEKHHRYKIDSPSGTAKMIYNTIHSELEKPINAIHGRNSNAVRKPNEIGVHSIRGGTVVGEHTVYFFGENETISITHSASSKQLFAYGAITAGEFIAKKPAGLYNMDDLINA